MTIRHNRAGIDDRWFRKVKTDDGVKTVPSPLHGTVKRWRVRWVIGGAEKSKVFDRKPDAQKHLNKVLIDIANGALYSKESFGAVAEAWFATKSHRKPKTIAGYRSILDTIVLPRWGQVELSDITYENYTSWLGSLGTSPSKRKTAGLSSSRITQTHQLVGAVLAYAVKTKKISENVARELKRSEDLPRLAERRKHRYLSHVELINLGNAMEGYEVLTLVLGYCGLRFGEAAALRGIHVGDAELDIRSSASTVTKLGVVEGATKTHKSRQVPVPKPLWELLKEIIPDDPLALVFPNATGGFLRSDTYRRAFLRACKEVGITGATTHDLRHTAASLAISAGANAKAVQRTLGHASAAMTLDVYADLFPDDLAAVAAALSTAIEATAVPLRYERKMEENNVS